MTRAAQACIDLGALRHNLARARACAPGQRVMAIIKANGYGHGMARVARALDTAEAFGVASIDEALTLRAGGVTQPIVLLEGFFEAQELALIQQHGLETVIHHSTQLEILEAQPPATPINTWLKVDSGMHRLGFAPAAVMGAYQRLAACRGIATIGLLTHLASADDPRSAQTPAQLACFAQATAGLRGERAIANSAAILAWPEAYKKSTWIRPGLMLYGASPIPPHTAAAYDLQPVMTLSTQLIAINHYPAGAAIGYGQAWSCPENMPVGVAAIGYGDGYPRHAAAGTPVLLNGARVPLIGRVSMDMITLDLRTQPHARLGDTVTLWGAGLPVEEVAACAGTIPYTLLCAVTPRVRIVEQEHG